MDNEIKRMSAAEFQSEGYLQEVNRRFLHPLGLALEMVTDVDTGEKWLGGVWDYRDDPEGIYFDGDFSRERAEHVLELERERADARRDALGFVIEPKENGR